MKYLAIFFTSGAVVTGLMSSHGRSPAAETHMLIFAVVLALAAIMFAILEFAGRVR